MFEAETNFLILGSVWTRPWSDKSGSERAVVASTVACLRHSSSYRFRLTTLLPSSMAAPLGWTTWVSPVCTAMCRHDAS